jgi:hypothetical protein
MWPLLILGPNLKKWRSEIHNFYEFHSKLLPTEQNIHFFPCVSSCEVRINDSFLKKITTESSPVSFFQVRLQAVFKWGTVSVSILPLHFCSHPTPGSLSLSGALHPFNLWVIGLVCYSSHSACTHTDTHRHPGTYTCTCMCFTIPGQHTQSNHMVPTLKKESNHLFGNIHSLKINYVHFLFLMLWLAWWKEIGVI